MNLSHVADRRIGRTGWRIGLLALAALLAALAVAALARPVSAQSPSGLQLVLSLADDSDNIVPAGSTIEVKAALRYADRADLQLATAGGSLYISGNVDWESTGRLRLQVGQQNVRGGAWGPHNTGPDSGKFTALDGRTMAIGGAGVTLWDLETGRSYHIQTPTASQINATRDMTTGGFTPTSAGSNAPSTDNAAIRYGTGAGGAWSAAATTGAGATFGRSVAVWHQDDDTAWVFVGSKNDTVNGHNNIGRVYIYKVVYDDDADPPTRVVTLERNIEPQHQDYMNDYGVADSTTGKASALFGSSVAVSANGKFLAVAAAEINLIGAVYVYERPGITGRTPSAGPGAASNNLGVTAWADWGDLTQNSAAKIAPTAIPDWDGDGDIFQTKPGGRDYANDGTADGVPDNLKHWLPACNAACQKIWAYAYSDFGKDAIAISEDGLTIAVGAEQKNLPDAWTPGRYGYYEWNTCPNAQTGAYTCTPVGNWEGHFRNGEAYIFTPNSAGQTAGYWRGTNLWNLGHVTGVEVIRTLQAQPFGAGPGVQNFGARIDLSNDGKSVAITAPGAPGAGVDQWIDNYVKKTPTRAGRVYVFNRPGASWGAGLDNSPDATLQLEPGINTPNFGAHNIDFSPDSKRLAVTDSLGRLGGQTWIFEGTSGAWGSATTARATALTAPLSAADFGWATYELSGDSNRLIAGFGRLAVWVYDANLNILAHPDSGGPCRFDPVDGIAGNGDDIHTCELTLPDSRIVIPMGTPDGPFTISGSVTIGGTTYPGELTVTVGNVDEVSRTEFGFDTQADGTTYPDSIGRTGATSTRMLLKVLNENGGASAKGSLSSVYFTTTQGTLSASIGGKSGACQMSGGLSCQIDSPQTAITASNADQIRLTLTAPSNARPGNITVRAVVLSTSGTQLIETLTVAIAGPFDTLKIGEASTSVLNVGTPDTGADKDDRDIALLSVRAEDAGGNRVMLPGTAMTAASGGLPAIPDHRLTIKDPEGSSNPAGISARWLPNAAGNALQVDSQGNPQIEIDVDAAAAAALKTGEYTIEARVNRVVYSQTFMVGAGPANIQLGEPVGTLAIGEIVSLTALVTDADDRPVGDGTPITFGEQKVGANTVLVLASMSSARTVDGEATVRVRIVNNGSAAVTAAADGIRAAQVITVAGTTATTVAGPVVAGEQISNTEPGDFAVWQSRTSTTAKALLPRLPNVLSILLWSDGRWLRYAVVDNQLIPGSMNFDIPPGAVLWLANGE